MQTKEERIQEIGKTILSYANTHPEKASSWYESLLNRMMENENFRVASLRFTDVAPTLRDDEDFMQHLVSYFKNVGGFKFFLESSIAETALISKVVAPLVRKNIKTMARTFIAGETVDDSISMLEKLHNKGVAFSVDLLGEAVLTKTESDHFVSGYENTIKTLSEVSKTWDDNKYPEKDRLGDMPRANVSIKLSALYEHINTAAHEDSKAVLCNKFKQLLDSAMEHNCFINVDVEQFSILPLTLEVFETVLLEPPYCNYPHIGIVCQAYLKDSDKVLDLLIDIARRRATPFSIRLVKGAYWDFEQAHSEQSNWPCPVFSQKEETDINYENLLRTLIKSFPAVRPCIGSHNARSLSVAIALTEEFHLKAGDVEFQMLYGMANPFRDALVAQGFRVRQYCPIGEFIPGMSYLVRRLLENTANQSFLRMHGKQSIDSKTLLAAPVAPEAKAKEVKEFEPFSELDFSITGNRKQAEHALKKWEVRLPIQVEVENGRADNQGYIEHLCPWNHKIVATRIALAASAQAEDAVESAWRARSVWQKTPVTKRAEILEKAATLIERDWDELFALQVFEAGKDWHSADADLAEGADFINYYAQQIKNLQSKNQPISLWGEDNKTIYEPKGVTAVIAPWNFPFAISAGMVCAALAAGNPVVYKPAEQTSATGLKLYKILLEAGVPEDVLHFIPGKGEEVGATLVRHPKVATIAFTGSREVGLGIISEAAMHRAGQNHVKKCIIEMGGKNAIIVDSDADLDEAIPGVVSSAFGFQGQKCSACSRVIVIGSAAAPFKERLKDYIAKLKIGAAENPLFDVNAVIDTEAQQKIEGYIEKGVKEGVLLAQVEKPEKLQQGCYVLPTVFHNLKEGASITKDEIFGPVLAVYEAESIEDAVEMAMDSEYALTGALYSRHPENIAYAHEHFKVGNLYINRGSTGALVGRQPFGGGGLSGTGTKAGGPDYLFHFLEPRVITENTMRRGYAPQKEG